MQLRQPQLDPLDGHVDRPGHVRPHVGSGIACIDGHDGPCANELSQLDWLERAYGPWKKRLHELLHLLFADGADDCVLNSPLGDDHEGRHTLNTKLLRDDGRFVDVDPDHFDLAGLFARESLDLWGDCLARLAPIGRKLHEDGQLAAQHLLLKIPLGNERDAAPALRRPRAAGARAASCAAKAAQNRHSVGSIRTRWSPSRGDRPASRALPWCADRISGKSIDWDFQHMVIKDNDTDPSTPSARRASEAPPALIKGPNHNVAPDPAAPRPGTDPGVGDPPSQPGVAPKRSLGVVVPAPGILLTPLPPAAATPDPPAGTPKKDSVELLLEGMGEQRLDRPKTTPQSDGEASATYHTEHTVHPSEHPPPEDPAKVLLDRPLTPTAIQPRRSLRAPPSGSNNREAAATILTPSPVGRRVLVAAMAGIMVVVAFFLVLELAIRRMPMAAAPFTQPIPPATPPAPPVAVESPAAPIPNPHAETIASTAPPSSATARARASTPLVQVPKRHAKPAISASASTALPSGDLGEFRTSF